MEKMFPCHKNKELGDGGRAEAIAVFKGLAKSNTLALDGLVPMDSVPQASQIR
jgi:hypothetical protein